MILKKLDYEEESSEGGFNPHQKNGVTSSIISGHGDLSDEGSLQIVSRQLSDMSMKSDSSDRQEITQKLLKTKD